MPLRLASAHTRRPTLVDRYMNEELNLSGEILTRGELIAILKEDGMDDRCIDRYLQGVELRMSLYAQRG